MERYVRSRGISVDYHWLHIAENGQESKEPPISELISLIQSDKLSVVLARSDDQLILLVTGLNTKKSRIDKNTRHIRNSVAWVGSNSDEATLRMLAAQSLKGSLTERIDSVVTSGKDGSFQVDYKKLEDFETANRKTAGNFPANQKQETDLKRKIGKISEKLKNELATELEQYCLPSTDGPLVVVTEFKARKTLEGAKVWRGLSTLLVNNFDEFPEKWTPGNSTQENVNNILDIPQSLLKNLDSNLKKLLGLSLIIIVLGLPLAWWKLPFLQVAINQILTSISSSTATQK